MEREETKLLRELRDPDLPRGVRGYQEDATRNLLDLVAVAFDRVAQERDRLRESAADSPDADVTEESHAEAIGRTVSTAAALGDQMVAEARQQADAVHAEAEGEAQQLLAAAREERANLEGELGELRRERGHLRETVESERNEAREAANREVDEALAGKRAEIARLDDEAAELRSVLEKAKADLVTLARAALQHLDELQDARGGREAQAVAAEEPFAPWPEPASSAPPDSATEQ